MTRAQFYHVSTLLWTILGAVVAQGGVENNWEFVAVGACFIATIVCLLGVGIEILSGRWNGFKGIGEKDE